MPFIAVLFNIGLSSCGCLFVSVNDLTAVTNKTHAYVSLKVVLYPKNQIFC